MTNLLLNYQFKFDKSVIKSEETVGENNTLLHDLHCFIIIRKIAL